MSGFEIAGIVLGGFPILYEASKVLRSRYEDTKSWWRFEREFGDFIAAVEREHIAFKQALEILLEPIVGLSEHELSTLQSEPQSQLWFDSRIQAELRSRVQAKYYSWFMRQLIDLNVALQELHSLLPIGKAYHMDSRSLESELYRLKTTFFHKKDTLLLRIIERNKSVYDFLERASHVSRLTVSTHPPSLKGNRDTISSILHCQNQARSLHYCFRRSWTCSCRQNSRHPYSITVEGHEMMILFKDHTNRRTQVRIEFETDVPVEQQGPIPQMNAFEEVSVLSQQISVKGFFKSFNDKGHKGIRGLASSAISAFSAPVLLGEGQYDGLGRPPLKIKKKKKQVTFGLPSTKAKEIKNVTAASQQPQLPVSRPTTTGTEISNMCMTINQTGSAISSCLGFIEAGRGTKLFLHLEPPSQQLPEFDDLENFLISTPRRNARLKMGHAAILTALRLGPEWISDRLSKKTLLVRSTAVVSRDVTDAHPYFAHSSIHATLQESSSASITTSGVRKVRASLLALGILLLELLYRETLEQQPFRVEYLSGGQPNDSTDLCTALRWQAKVEDEFGHKLADAIRRCVLCAFEPSPDLSNASFINAVWATVAKPIEDFLEVYN